MEPVPPKANSLASGVRGLPAAINCRPPARWRPGGGAPLKGGGLLVHDGRAEKGTGARPDGDGFLARCQRHPDRSAAAGESPVAELPFTVQAPGQHLVIAGAGQAMKRPGSDDGHRGARGEDDADREVAVATLL